MTGKFNSGISNCIPHLIWNPLCEFLLIKYYRINSFIYFDAQKTQRKYKSEKSIQSHQNQLIYTVILSSTCWRWRSIFRKSELGNFRQMCACSDSLNHIHLPQWKLTASSESSSKHVFVFFFKRDVCRHSWARLNLASCQVCKSKRRVLRLCIWTWRVYL